MKKTRSEAFVIRDESTVEQVLQRMGELYHCQETRQQTLRDYFFDTFDWRLFEKGNLLHRRGKTCFLSLPDEQLTLSEAGPGGEKFFASDFKAGKLRDTLESIAEVRALLLIVAVKTERKNFDLRNFDKKAIVRLAVDDVLVTGNNLEKKLPLTLHLKEVRGYDNAFSKVFQLLKESGLPQLDGEDTLFQSALYLINRRPFDYSSKFSLALDSNASIQETTATILNYLFDIMERNHDGVVGDIDSEFLHDFRVAIRKTRSLLSHMKKLFPAETFTSFLEEFRWLGSLTGPVRDLDVYLTAREKYQAMLPEQLHKGLHEFFSDLELQRKAKLLAMRKGLSSARYQKLLQEWKKFISTAIVAIEIDEPLCRPAAIKMIRKRFRRLVREGAAITNDSPDFALHRLRIEGKKLRYLLEFFSSFFDAEEIASFIKNLKKLQTNLGDFNDISVQTAMLDSHRRKLTGRNKRSVLIAAALGGLLTQLARQRKEIRENYENTFNDFVHPENQERFLAAITMDEK